MSDPDCICPACREYCCAGCYGKDCTCPHGMSDYIRAYRDWTSDDEPWPGPEDGELRPCGDFKAVIVQSGRRFGKLSGAISSIGTHMHQALEESFPGLLKFQQRFLDATYTQEKAQIDFSKLSQVLKTSDHDPIGLRFDPKIPTRPPHSMTGDGKIFDRFGRRKR